MMRKDFEARLKAHPKNYSRSVITGYPTECGWVERNLGVDLDQEYANDRLQSVLDRLKFDEGNPLCARISGNAYTNLATYRRAVTSYRNFRDDDLKAASEVPVYSDDNEPRTAPAPPVTSAEQEDENAIVAVTVDAGAMRGDLGALVYNCSVSELLALHGATLDELRVRKIVRSANAPGGDYAELLFTRAFGWTRTENSVAGYDAIDWSGRRYQIKSRRLSNANGSRQLSALRRLPDQHFDYLAAVLFEKDYKVGKAAMIPHETVVSLARFQQHTNSWVFYLDDAVWQLPGIGDVTQQLRHAAAELDAL
jgi:hypothetical protein